MTRQVALKLLKSGLKGVDGWNTFRSRGEEMPILHYSNLANVCLGANASYAADLSEADLSHSNFKNAELNFVRFNNADLMQANFEAASLGDAVLVEADLSGAGLRRCDLSGAILLRANLRYAELRETVFRNSFVSGADFSNAELANTEFLNVDLSGAIGLEHVKHRAPSTVGIDTIYRSGGKIPEAFLRGCGVPDSFIQYVPSLVSSMSPVQFYSCFISYSHRDEAFCQRLYSRLRDEHLRVWYAPEAVAGGKKLIDQIDSAIRLHDKLLLVLSEHSMKSDWVATEIYKARQREKKESRQVLFPIRLCDFESIHGWESFDADSGKDMAREVREYFVPDFSNWKDHDSFEQGFARLLKDLRATELRA